MNIKEGSCSELSRVSFIREETSEGDRCAEDGLVSFLLRQSGFIQHFDISAQEGGMMDLLWMHINNMQCFHNFFFFFFF